MIVIMIYIYSLYTVRIRPESAMGINKETLSLTTAKIYHELIYTKTNFVEKI